MKTAESMPEIYTGYREGLSETILKNHAVASANHYATEAGDAILKAGGNAADAAVAIQAVLGLTEPQSSGLGGGAYVLYRHNGRIKTIDGRETAPANVDAHYCDGDLRNSVRAAGVPGAVAALGELHRDAGQLSWEECLRPALHLARHGFVVSERMGDSLKFFENEIMADPMGRELFNGVRPGVVMRNPHYAKSLEILAKEGPESFYTGTLAQTVLDRVQQGPSNLTAEDFKNYKAEVREPISTTYRGYEIVSVPLSTSGASTVFSILKILSNLDVDIASIAEGKAPSATLIHQVSEAYRLAYADRDAYLNDSDAARARAPQMWDDAYAKTRAASIGDRAMGVAQPGFEKATPGPVDEHGTSHFQVVDAQGNAVAVTTSVEAAFGSFAMAGGFFINNQLRDFSAAGTINEPAPGRRPRSSMTPAFVFNPDGSLHAVVGSPGGALIINFVVKTLLCLLDAQMDPQQAANYPNFGAMNTPITWIGADHPLVKAGKFDEVKAELEAMGHQVEYHAIPSGVAVFLMEEDGTIRVGVDPRREGTAM
ncbi:MAG: gamma-glutamyltransferase [Corynebacterium sp.]|nr:gamma-glutamyltransferase [Corynebacterium sp.]